VLRQGFIFMPHVMPAHESWEIPNTVKLPSVTSLLLHPMASMLETDGMKHITCCMPASFAAHIPE